MRVRPIWLDIVTSADCSNFPRLHKSGMFLPRIFALLGFAFWFALGFSASNIWMNTYGLRQELWSVEICNIPELSLFEHCHYCQALNIDWHYFMEEFWRSENDQFSSNWLYFCQNLALKSSSWRFTFKALRGEWSAAYSNWMFLGQNISKCLGHTNGLTIKKM